MDKPLTVLYRNKLLCLPLRCIIIHELESTGFDSHQPETPPHCSQKLAIPFGDRATGGLWPAARWFCHKSPSSSWEPAGHSSEHHGRHGRLWGLLLISYYTMKGCWSKTIANKNLTVHCRLSPPNQVISLECGISGENPCRSHVNWHHWILPIFPSSV